MPEGPHTLRHQQHGCIQALSHRHQIAIDQTRTQARKGLICQQDRGCCCCTVKDTAVAPLRVWAPLLLRVVSDRFSNYCVKTAAATLCCPRCTLACLAVAAAAAESPLALALLLQGLCCPGCPPACVHAAADCQEGTGLQGSTAHQETINVGLQSKYNGSNNMSDL